MSELTDLELCKRISEIDGVPTQFVGGRLITVNVNGGVGVNYNPLTNKALLFDLMVKNKVWVDHGEVCCFTLGNDGDSDFATSCVSFKDIPLPHAILTAILEANND